MKLVRFSSVANVVSAVRKYKCHEADIGARADELAQLLTRVFIVDGKPVLKSARLFFLNYSKLTDSGERPLITEADARSAEVRKAELRKAENHNADERNADARHAATRSKKAASPKGTVMYLEGLSNELEKPSETLLPPSSEVSLTSEALSTVSDTVEEMEATAECGAKVVATVRATDDSQLVVAMEMTVQLAPHVAPFFRVLSTILAAKLTDNDVYIKEYVDELADLYELALAEKAEEHSTNFKISDVSAKDIALISQVAPATIDDTDYFSEVSFRLAESLPVIVWTALPDGYINFINSKFSKYTGFEDVDAYGTGWHKVLHPADFEKATSKFAQSMQTGEMYENEHRILNINTGQYRWILAQAVPVRDRDGKIRIWFGTATDIDEQKRAQERLQFVMDTIPACIFWKDINLVYLGCNKNFAQIAGASSAEQIVGKTDVDLPWTAEETEFYNLCDRKVMSENKAQLNVIEPLTKENGEVAWLSTSKMPIHDAAGNVIGVLGHFQDITETIRLQTQREDFMASLAHDLKVPVIGAIRALDALLQGYVGPLDQKQTDFIQCLHRSHENLLLMVKNLLQVLRYESEKDQFVHEHFDLVGILNECVKHAVPALMAKHLHLDLVSPKKLIIAADRTALKAVLINLLSNAINSAPEHTTVKVNLDEKDDAATLAVHNGGEPISKEDLEQLFQRLWQGKRFGAGAGLGLFLCRQIAEGHGGTMSCLSSKEEGTVMTFSVPINTKGNSSSKQTKNRRTP